MRNIEPVQIWFNGQPKEASILNVRIVNDDLKTTCTFYYELKEANIILPPVEEDGQETSIIGGKLAEGNVTLSGNDYLDWDGSNDGAYDYIISTLNLILIN